METDVKYPESALRAQAIRIYAGFKNYGGQKRFAEHINVSSSLWGMVERGATTFSYNIIKLLKRKYPSIDTEWLREGYEGNMPPAIMNPLNQILDELRKGRISA